jgi:hypothetical protein
MALPQFLLSLSQFRVALSQFLLSLLKILQPALCIRGEFCEPLREIKKLRRKQFAPDGVPNFRTVANSRQYFFD